MAKLNLPTIGSGYLSTEALTDAFDQIETALDNTLSRDGSTPNQMEADLDMNGHVIINTGDSDSPSSLITREDMEDYVDARASGLLVQDSQTFTASAAQTLFTLTEFTYQPHTGNIAVYVNGLRKFDGFEYNETSSNLLTFVAGMAGGEVVQVVHTDFIATVELPEHQHAWGQITGAPVYATRWPTWDEVTGKPSTFTPAAHLTNAADIVWNGNRVNDEVRGVFVQSSEPTTVGPGDFGYLWFF